MRQRWWIVLGIAALVTLLLLGLTGHGQLPDVSVVRVSRQTIDKWISTNGTVEPIEPFVLRARIDTFVTGVMVVDGQSVKRGQLLVELDASATAAHLAQARQKLLAARKELLDSQAGGPPVQVAQVKSDLTKAGATRDRLAAEQKTLDKLVADQAATREELAENTLELQQAEANLSYLRQKQQDLARQAAFDERSALLQIQQAQAQISDLSQKVASSRVVAPVDGTVYALPVKLGDYVQIGAPLVSVADLHRVRVRAYVDEVDLGSIGANQPVEIQWDGLPGRTWHGQTEVIPKQVVPYQERRVGEVLCSVQNSEAKLLPNTNVDVRILIARHPGTLVLPRSAVQGEGASRYVYWVDGNRLHQRPVKVGVENTEMLEIVEGLHEGDRVALPGSVNLEDGLKIHPVGAQ
ncbi:MAG TPA: efflux RND transporter periplasmic adaptor subunit [Candidatus Dormibacteraeota bacterium]|nr:efflux RND transporter periplasmic adaptor subunit [Candidatus Dormibacteraeota bacterium]